MMKSSRPTEDEASVLDRIVAASIDQRAHNVRYRQTQLHLLHRFLRQNASTICDLIAKDSEYSTEETELEFFATMKSIAILYQQLDFDAALDDEYAVARNQSTLQNRTPHGIVLIRPSSFNLFFSLFSALAAALAAGNCVVIELKNTLRGLDSFLWTNFTVLDKDLVAILPSITNSKFLSQCFILDQTASPPNDQGAGGQRTEPGLAIAIVDRTADVTQAASALCTARTLFHGQSPNAPDLVIVNEWVWDSFVTACSQKASQHAAFASAPTARGKPTKTLGALPSDAQNVLFQSLGFRLVQGKIGANLAKIRDQTLCVVPSTGLVHSVMSASKSGPFRAVYCFADLKTAKFLSQNIDSQASFVNDIPLSLLVGPPRPTTSLSPTDMRLCYDIAFMSKPKPVVAEPVLAAPDLTLSAVTLQPQKRDSDLATRLRSQAVEPLSPIRQPSGSGAGFFDQGILTGLVAFVLPSVLLVGFTTFKAAQLGWKYWLLKDI